VEVARRIRAQTRYGRAVRARHTTSMGDISATGKSLTLKLCDVLEFRDDLLVRQRSYFDSGSMMAQLGLTSGQQATATS